MGGMTAPARDRARSFCDRFGPRVPILQAPMAGACPPALAAAVANAGGMGGLGALMTAPAAILTWAATVRGSTNGAFQINLWAPDPPPGRDPAREDAVRAALAAYGPEPPPLGEGPFLHDFAAQCAALLEAAPPVASTIMGLFPPEMVAELKRRGILWIANATTAAEARAGEAAGADAVVAQGGEAGGHRGSFDPADGEAQSAGLFALLPRIADAVRVPVIAAGGVMDGRGVAAALTLGASAVQMGTAFLRCPETALNAVHSAALATTEPEATALTRVFSGRAARNVANAVTRAGIPTLPYPLQRVVSGPMKDAAAAAGDTARMHMWAGQGAILARAEPAAEVVRRVWAEAESLLPP